MIGNRLWIEVVHGLTGVESDDRNGQGRYGMEEGRGKPKEVAFRFCDAKARNVVSREKKCRLF